MTDFTQPASPERAWDSLAAMDRAMAHHRKRLRRRLLNPVFAWHYWRERRKYR